MFGNTFNQFYRYPNPAFVREKETDPSSREFK